MTTPTLQDARRFDPIMAKVQQARIALTQADTEIGRLIPTLEAGADDDMLDAIEVLTRAIERARMATTSVYHPVRRDWAGPGPGGNAPDALSWRHRG